MTSTTKVWLITGCSSGFGRYLAEAVLKLGDRLVATARNVSSLAYLSSLATGDEQLLSVKLDVTKQEDVDEAFSQAVKHFGRVDVVVNNAGYGLLGEFESISDEQIQAQLDVNLWGVLRVSRAAIKVFRDVNNQKQPKSGGRLIQITSVGGFTCVPALSIYHTSKFAVEGFSESLAKELNPEWNIKITIVQPGAFATDFAGRSLAVTQPLQAYEGSPAAATRHFVAIVDTVAKLGDPARGADAIVKVAQAAHPPLKLPLGPDAVGVIQGKLDQVKAELDEWKTLSTSTSDEPNHKLSDAMEKLWKAPS